MPGETSQKSQTPATSTGNPDEPTRTQQDDQPAMQPGATEKDVVPVTPPTNTTAEDVRSPRADPEDQIDPADEITPG